MALPAAFTTALAKPQKVVDLWLEIEGLPYGIGMTPRASSFFATRSTVNERRAGVLGGLVDVPNGVAQQVRQYDGDSSIASLSLDVMNETFVGWLSNSGRTDGRLSLGAPYWKASETVALNAVRRPSSSSSAPGAGKFFKATAITTGICAGSEPAWPASGTVVDGGVTWTMIASSQDDGTPLTIAFTGNASAWPASGVFYIGRETVSYTSKVADARGGYFVCDYRTMYQLPGHTAKWAHTTSDVITQYPRFLATRRATLFATLDGTDANKIARWVGTIRDASMPKGLASVQLDLSSAEAELKVKVFGRQICGKVKVGCRGLLGEWTEDTNAEPTPGDDLVELDAATVTGRPWVDGERAIVKIGDEYLSARLQNSAATPFTVAFDGTGDARGLFGTEIVEHHVGEEVHEVIFTGAYSASGGPEYAASRFTQGDNVLEVLLQFLLSRKGDGANGTYDVLPAGWGVGISQARVDVAGILALRDTWLPGDSHRWVYDEPFQFKQEMANLLRARACYPVTLLNDLITIRRLSPPIGDTASLRALNVSRIVAMPSFSANLTQVVGRVRFLCDFDPEDPLTKLVGEIAGPDSEAQEFYAGIFQTVEIQGRGLWTGSLAFSARFGSSFGAGALEVAARLFDVVRDRRGRPFPVLELEAGYRDLDVEVGDQLLLSLANVPNPATGTRGLSGCVVEVQKKQIEDRRGVTVFQVVILAYAFNYRYVAPSATLLSGGTVTQLILNAHEFTDGSGTALDSDAFTAGDVIEVWDPTLTTLRGQRTISSVDYALGKITIPSSITVTAGDVVLPVSHGSAVSHQRQVFAFLADASDAGALTGASSPHHYAP